MSQEEQNEWPSFEAVLRDVAPSDVARRTRTAIATSRRALDHRDGSFSEPVRPVDDAVDAAAVEAHTPVPHLDLLPDPLPPLELDTSAVRALLEPQAERVDEEFDLDALAPLEPLAIEPLLIEDPPPDGVDFEATPPDELSEVAENIASDNADLASEETPVDASFVTSSPVDESPVDESPFDESPFPTSPFETSPFEAPSFEASEVDTLGDIPGIELPVSAGPSMEVFEDLDLGDELVFEHDIDVDFVDEEAIHEESAEDEDVAGAVFELDADALSAAVEAEEEEHGEEGFAEPAIDLFDLTLSSDEIEADRIELHGSELYSGTPELADEHDFDSIAMADEIEGHLTELTHLDDFSLPDSVDDDQSADSPREVFDLDNVIPIRADQETPKWLQDEVSPMDDTAAPSPEPAAHSGWVGLDEVTPSEPEETIDDPWAHMRPHEEPRSKGFWSRFPKFFGGEERIHHKTKRQAESDANGFDDELDISFDSKCPNCGDECQVDLDDPIGRRVHVSCPSCDHMWFTPYLINGEDSPESQTG